MRLPLVPIIAIIILNLVVDFYIWRRVEHRWLRQRWPGVAYLWSSILCLIYIIVAVSLPRRSGSDDMLLVIMWMLYGYFSIYIPKYVYCIFALISSIPRLFGRRSWRVLPVVGTVLGFIVFAVMWWGALVNRVSYQINEVDIEFADLPDAFDGYKFVQFSDFHVGTYGSDTSYVSNVVDAINSLGADAIFFTGDLVNRRTDELVPFVKPLSRLYARDGVYSILGNHDYGDYSTWPSAEAKTKNMDMMRRLQKQAGWSMLNNESVYLRQDGDSIALIGVENWGEPPFTAYGNLEDAYAGLDDDVFKILLTHNPRHWETAIADNQNANVALTLSGHTHAMQMQVGRWSPSSLRYDKWGGLYDDKSKTHKLYVNIGIGTVAIPARIGATPEITVFTLHKAKK